MRTKYGRKLISVKGTALVSTILYVWKCIRGFEGLDLNTRVHFQVSDNDLRTSAHFVLSC